MSKLYDARLKVEKLLTEQKKGDVTELRGKIGMKIGFLLSLVTPTSPDDAARLERLRKAVEEVLHEKL
jgi:hypothetical protein